MQAPARMKWPRGFGTLSKRGSIRCRRPSPLRVPPRDASASMSPKSDDDAEESLPPRSVSALFGHAAAEAALLAAYRGTRVPHAFLLVGPRGIGKATLAYR